MRAKNNPDDLLNNATTIPTLADDSDEKTLVAMNNLQTLETLLRSVSSAPPVVAQMENVLIPVLSITLQHEFVELYDDLFELAHSITYYQRSISHNMWLFFEQIYALVKGTGIDFIEELVNVLDNYVSYGGPFLADHTGYKGMLVDIFETAMHSTQLGANDRVSACKLAGQTLICLKGSIDHVSHQTLIRNGSTENLILIPAHRAICSSSNELCGKRAFTR